MVLRSKWKRMRQKSTGVGEKGSPLQLVFIGIYHVVIRQEISILVKHWRSQAIRWSNRQCRWPSEITNKGFRIVGPPANIRNCITGTGYRWALGKWFWSYDRGQGGFHNRAWYRRLVYRCAWFVEHAGHAHDTHPLYCEGDFRAKRHGAWSVNLTNISSVWAIHEHHDHDHHNHNHDYSDPGKY